MEEGRFTHRHAPLTLLTFALAWPFLFDGRPFIVSVATRGVHDLHDALILAGFLAAVRCVLRPGSVVSFLAMISIAPCEILARLPYVQNHAFFELGAYGVMLGASPWLLSGRWSPEVYWRRVAPVLAWALFALYFWVVVHKLNTGFLDPAISCGVMQLYNLKGVLPFVPTGQGTFLASIWGTLLAEIALPLGIAWRRTRRWALLGGVGFHFVLGIRYPGFNSFVLAVYLVFLAPETCERLRGGARAVRDDVARRLRLAAAYAARPRLGSLLLAIALALLWLAVLGRPAAGLEPFNRTGLYFAYWGFAVFLLARHVGLGGADGLAAVGAGAFRVRDRWLLVFPALIFLNGASPHLGIKNVQALAMFSNLRTEDGRTNHLVFPARLQVSDNLRDLVTVRRSNVRSLYPLAGPLGNAPFYGTHIRRPAPYLEHAREHGFQTRFFYRIPFVYLRNALTDARLRGAKGIFIEYERGGRVHRTEAAEDDPELSGAGLLQRKFMLMRAVPDSDRDYCMW